MIGRIFNWLGGGFFRTIGRFIAFIVLGAIVSILLSKSDFKIGSLFGLEYVKADTYYNVWVGDWRDNYDTLTNNPTFNNLYQYKTINSGDYYFTNLYMTNSYNAHGKNVIINGYINVPLGLENTYQCSQWYDGGNTLHCEKWTSANGGELSVNLWVINDSNPCVIEWTNNPYNTGDNYKFFQATCHTEVNTINRVIARVRYVPNTQASYSTTYDFGLNRNMKLEVGDNQDIINNQNQNAQSIIQSQENQTQTIMDTNMTETNSTATSFFDNFSDTDHGGLSSIITAPLTVINSMLSNTCVAPSATWKGATITLPCGNMFWDRPGASDLRNLLNVFYGGFICYYAIRRLFLLIEGMKDPTHDNIEVAEL